MELVSPLGAVIDVDESLADRYIDAGYTPAGKPKPSSSGSAPKKKAPASRKG